MGAERILALNIGAGQITLAEFRVAAGKAPVLMQYGVAPLGLDPESDLDPSGFINAALTDIMKETGIKPGPLVMSVSGQSVFPRFVKLASMPKDKIRQYIATEAEQNVPFPIEELTWDYQLVGSDELGEQNTMIVAAKTESITALTGAVASVGLEPSLVDVAPLAIYNCVANGYPLRDGCIMVLDIGSRSTNLVFVEQGKVFYRSIPVAGNTITQEIARTFQTDFRTAEAMKIESGFVSLGGVTAAEDEESDRMSKCIRGVVTRLHAEVNRSINFYRSQQNGSAPARVLLTGGSSNLQHMDTFFREKLRIDVDFLNPFKSVAFGPRVDKERAEGDFLELAEVVGIALRESAMGSVAINLMPPLLLEKKEFRRKIPFFAVSAAALLVSMAFLMLAGRERQSHSGARRDAADARLSELRLRNDKLKKEQSRREGIKSELARYDALVGRRVSVLRRLEAIEDSLLGGMWLVSVSSSDDDTSMTIVARGFSDSLKRQTAASPGKTAAELFGSRLTAHKPFSGQKCEILQQKNLSDFGGRVSEIKISVGVNGEYSLGKAVK